MLVVQPWAARIHIDDGLSTIQAAMVGETLKGVRYVVPRGETWPVGHSEGRVHDVDMAVELITSSGAGLLFLWAMDGLNEGLAIELRSPEEVDIDLPGEAVDVSRHTSWERFAGKAIASSATAWHVPNEGCPEMPWAFRVEFANRSNVVVALGESTGFGITYSPDSLVVIFDEQMAVSYRIPASATSSYG